MEQPIDGAKVLFIDIELSPILAHVWALFDQNVGLNQIVKDWFVLSWAAKWKGSTEMLYQDNRGAEKVEDDKNLIEGIWKLIDEADIIVGQNSKKFDIRKLNARFVIHGIKPPSSFRHIDTLQIARQKFGFTSNKLEYLIDKLCPGFQKYPHQKFPGHKLWMECLNGNIEAWDEMAVYNQTDVLGLERVYDVIIPWATGANSWNPDIYHVGMRNVCVCGSIEWHKNGFFYGNAGKFQRYSCKACGKEIKSPHNELSKEKRQSLLKP